MRRTHGFLVLAAAAAWATAIAADWPGVLHEHPAIQYAVRPTTDRAAKLAEAMARGGRTLARDAQSGYLRPLKFAEYLPAHGWTAEVLTVATRAYPAGACALNGNQTGGLRVHATGIGREPESRAHVPQTGDRVQDLAGGNAWYVHSEAAG